jgi:hypothetical protein
VFTRIVLKWSPSVVPTDTATNLESRLQLSRMNATREDRNGIDALTSVLGILNFEFSEHPRLDLELCTSEGSVYPIHKQT